MAGYEQTLNEHGQQVSLMAWTRLQQCKYPELEALFAIPNGGHRHLVVASKLKAEGVKKGVPDLCLPVARKGFNALYIEMKKPGGVVKLSQKEWKSKLELLGNKVVIAYDWIQAKDALIDYLATGKRK